MLCVDGSLFQKVSVMCFVNYWSGGVGGKGLNWKRIMDFPIKIVGCPLKVARRSECLTPVLFAISLTAWFQTADLCNVSAMPFTCVDEGCQNNTHSAVHKHNCAHTHANKNTCKDNPRLPPFPTYTHTHRLSLSWVKGELGMSGTLSWQIIHQCQNRATLRRLPLTHNGWPSCMWLLNRNTFSFVCVWMGTGLHTRLLKLWQLRSVLLSMCVWSPAKKRKSEKTCLLATW